MDPVQARKWIKEIYAIARNASIANGVEGYEIGSQLRAAEYVWERDRKAKLMDEWADMPAWWGALQVFKRANAKTRARKQQPVTPAVAAVHDADKRTETDDKRSVWDRYIDIAMHHDWLAPDSKVAAELNCLPSSLERIRRDMRRVGFVLHRAGTVWLIIERPAERPVRPGHEAKPEAKASSPKPE